MPTKTKIALTIAVIHLLIALDLQLRFAAIESMRHADQWQYQLLRAFAYPFLNDYFGLFGALMNAALVVALVWLLLVALAKLKNVDLN